MQLIGVAFVIFTSTIFHRGLCYSFGAPASQCVYMRPNHGSVAQTGASPYEIKVKKSYYTPGENVRVSIESSSDNIKGYLIQARQVGANAAIGTFATLPANGTYVNCGNSKGGVSHNTHLAVKTINFEWVPPSNLSGNVSFYATVVKEMTTYWVKLQSPELYKREMQPTSTQLPSSTVQENISTTPQSMPTTQSNSTSTSMINSTSGSTPTAKSTCKPGDPKCDGTQLNHNVLVLFLIGFFLTFWQNVI